MKKTLSTLKYFIGWPLSLLAFFFVARLLIGKNNTFSQIHSINWYLLGFSIICYVLFFFVRALFWQKLLNTKGVHFSFKQTAATWGFSEFKRYIPGSVWSIISRSNAYEKQGGERKLILSGIVQEAEFIVIACLLISILSFNFIVFGLFHIPFAAIISYVSGFLVIILSFVFIFQQKLFTKKTKFFTHLLPDIGPTSTLYLLTLMIGAFSLFGLATYFSIDSFVNLYIPHILSLSAFFIFTFLVGYLSFFAPMGLGVREGLTTAGLARYISIPNAALGAIFSRIIQVVSELLFLGICFLWEKMRNTKIQYIEKVCITYKYEIFAFICSASYVTYFTLASFLKYTNFFTGRFDLGNMDQTVWNTIHGRIFQLTDPNGITTVSRLSFHADFMLILLSPLYLIWQDPRMLLFIQSLAIGVGGIFVFLIAKKIIKNKSIALAFTISYLLYPAIQYANLFDFHPVTIAVPLFLASWYFIQKKNILTATILLLLAATVKEEAWLIVGLFGIYFIFFQRKYFFGTFLSLFSFVVFYFLFWHAIPAAHGGDHFALSYYSDFGSTPGSVIANIFLSPIKIVSDIFGKGQLLYLLQLFLPTAFLPLAAFPLLVFAGPDLGISLLSQNAQLHEIYYHYSAIPTPFIFIAAIYGFSFLQKRFSYMSRFGVFIILVPASICAYAFGPLPGAYSSNPAMFTNQLSYAPLIDSFLNSIPRKYSVAATNNIGSHLSHRQKIFTIPVGLKDADVVVFLLNDSYAQPSLDEQKNMAKQLDNDPLYVKLYQYKDFVVYKKKAVPTYVKMKSKSLLPLFKGN